MTKPKTVTDEPTFLDLVAKLTREHPVRVPTDAGLVETTQLGLIDQLREAMFGDRQQNGGIANKAKLPINAPAVDLFQLIDRQVAEVWAAAMGRVPGQDTTNGLLAQWAAKVRDDTLVEITNPETRAEGEKSQVYTFVYWVRTEINAYNLLKRWATQIEELFDPPRTAPIKAACIQCGTREVWRQRDGESIRQSALIFVRDKETGDTTEARCQACGVSWWPYQFRFLAEQITKNENAEEQEA